eukprot:scaffold58492_cov59-Phaeocystis_antarctica.AAC.6
MAAMYNGTLPATSRGTDVSLKESVRSTTTRKASGSTWKQLSTEAKRHSAHNCASSHAVAMATTPRCQAARRAHMIGPTAPGALCVHAPRPTAATGANSAWKRSSAPRVVSIGVDVSSEHECGGELWQEGEEVVATADLEPRARPAASSRAPPRALRTFAAVCGSARLRLTSAAAHVTARSERAASTPKDSTAGRASDSASIARPASSARAFSVANRATIRRPPPAAPPPPPPLPPPSHPLAAAAAVCRAWRSHRSKPHRPTREAATPPMTTISRLGSIPPTAGHSRSGHTHAAVATHTHASCARCRSSPASRGPRRAMSRGATAVPAAPASCAAARKRARAARARVRVGVGTRARARVGVGARARVSVRARASRAERGGEEAGGREHGEEEADKGAQQQARPPLELRERARPVQQQPHKARPTGLTGLTGLTGPLASSRLASARLTTARVGRRVARLTQR